MKANNAVIFVGRNCKPEDEATMIKWYKEHHVPDLMKYKALRGATLMKILKPDEKYPLFMFTGQFDNDKDYDGYEAFLADARAKNALFPLSIKADFAWRYPFHVINSWEQYAPGSKLKKGSIFNITGRKCSKELEKDLVAWYTNFHRVELMEYKGLKAVTIMKILKQDGKAPDFLLCGEFNNMKDYEGYEVWRKTGIRTHISIQAEMNWRAQFQVVEVWER